MKQLCALFALLILGLDLGISQTQLGTDILGETPGDRSGMSVSISGDGNRVAIGAPINAGNGRASGHVRVYEWEGNSWMQMGADIDGEAVGDSSGHSVSLSGNGSRLAIGAPHNSETAFYAGHVRVYEWVNGSWTQMGPDIDGEARGDRSGWSVSLSEDGTHVAIGAPFNYGNGRTSGQVRVYNWANGNWMQVGADIDGENINDASGYSVSINANGRKVAIGALYNNGNGTTAGHARVYEWINGAWSQMGQDIDGEAAGDRAGQSVSLSANGTRVAVAAPFNGDNGRYAGQIRVFEWNNGTWTQLGLDINGEGPSNFYGFDVSLSGNGQRVIVDAIETGASNGRVRLFDWQNGAWSQIGSNIDGPMSNNYLGFSSDLSTDGTRVVVGAPGNLNGTFAGFVQVFELPATPTNIRPLYDSQLTIFPNPSEGVIYFRGDQPDGIRVLDMLGRTVLERQRTAASLDISTLPKGSYTLLSQWQDQWYWSKIVKR